ncbi:Translation initiation factor 3 subunit c [Malassezia vespertilionis]|uniref:Eukaryotic translation initiation factor 3 subunit C n=1 Tax=Malassezia vespertilionis TaxID=2020962 RepID=A0A2N1JAE2_9BASI|nr:Translation initiation factor 3 subunit c [Malassezia vespertilionis]PKI83514.1 Nip1p [Malassezia vespertilionis]WFD07250.1 Translation initiation factor 3 subunit c [Malassezia vespertilionis]
MSSRFFRAISDSESSSEEEEELLSDDEQQPTKAKGIQMSDDSDESDSDDGDDSDSDSDSEEESEMSDDGEPKARKPMSRFMRDAASDSESEEDAPKIIKSAKDKRLDEFDTIIRTIENAQRIDDWLTISKEFDALLRLCTRQKKLNEPIPPVFIRSVAALDTFLNQTVANKDMVKKMKGPNAKAMNGMKQKMKKTVKENETALQQFRADPEHYDEKVQAAQAAPLAPTLMPTTSAKPMPMDREHALPTEQETADDEFQTVGPGGKAAMTSDALFKNLASILEARGRKSTDRSEQINTLVKLQGAAHTPYQSLRVLLALMAARFDYSASANAFMPAEMWVQARDELNALLNLLSENKEYIVLEETEDYDDQVERRPNENGEGLFVPVRGSVISFVDRLEDEFIKSLQNVDPHTTEYVERLGDEKILYQIIVRGQSYFETVMTQPLPEKVKNIVSESLRRCVMRRLEHIYSKQDVIILALETANQEAQPNLVPSRITPSFEEVCNKQDGPTLLIHTLSVYLYKRSEVSGERQRTRAMLCHVYHHALHASYHIGRDFFLMSRLAESIHLADAATQILYNRVVVQLGLCAFRVGLIRECHAALQEIFAAGRVKELLGQGVSKVSLYNTATAEQEKMDRQRQLPFHMHINLELLECVYLVASMLLEVPNMASAGSDPELRKKTISRPFRRMLDYTDRLVFTAPPENTRDHVMQASKALQNGEWKMCIELIRAIKIWKLIPDREQVLEKLARHIQEEGLRTYLFNFGPHYDSLSLSLLVDTFELGKDMVRSIVSRMIWNDELAATLDPIHDVVVFQRMEVNKVQQLALSMADRANAMLEQNEWLLDSKLGDTRSGGNGGASANAFGDANTDRDAGQNRRDHRRKGRGRGHVQLQSQPLGQKV